MSDCKYCDDGIAIKIIDGKPHHPYSSDWLMDIWAECKNAEQLHEADAAICPHCGGLNKTHCARNTIERSRR